jgi:signal transduction histidine kinase
MLDRVIERRLPQSWNQEVLDALSDRVEPDFSGVLLVDGDWEMPDLRYVDLDQLARDLPRRVEATLGRPAALVLSPGCDSLPVLADPNQLGDALVQVVTSATDAGGDWVEVRAGRQAVTAAGLSAAQVNAGLTPGVCAFIEVADRGPELSDAVLARAFDPCLTIMAGGRGLGLSHVAAVVRSHGGAVRLRPRPGGGATVRIWLPVLPTVPPDLGS